MRHSQNPGEPSDNPFILRNVLLGILIIVLSGAVLAVFGSCSDWFKEWRKDEAQTHDAVMVQAYVLTNLDSRVNTLESEMKQRPTRREIEERITGRVASGGSGERYAAPDAESSQGSK